MGGIWASTRKGAGLRGVDGSVGRGGRKKRVKWIIINKSVSSGRGRVNDKGVGVRGLLVRYSLLS